MGESTHTPGPWRVCEHDVPGTTIKLLYISAQSGTHVPAHIEIAYTGAEPWQRVNARLIAASPNLLAACKVALAELEIAAELNEFNLAGRPRTKALLGQLRGAVALAEMGDGNG